MSDNQSKNTIKFELDHCKYPHDTARQLARMRRLYPDSEVECEFQFNWLRVRYVACGYEIKILQLVPEVNYIDLATNFIFDSTGHLTPAKDFKNHIIGVLEFWENAAKTLPIQINS